MNENNKSVEVQPSKRKLKKLYTRIKKQMEFYFSDSNLVKDKFLSSLISKDPDGYVDIEVFTTFNKIKALTNSLDMIVASVSRSDMFEVSENHRRVRRITPLELSKDFDACTLYVEKLPHYADQKWVKDVFGQFGSVKYVNVPRYKVTNKIKGFAFVEFESTDGVKNACEYYKLSAVKECSASEDESKTIKNAKKHKHDEVSERKGKKSRTRSISESSDKLTDFSSLKSDQHPAASDKNLDHDHDNPHKKGKRKRKRQDSDSEAVGKRHKKSTDEVLDTLVIKSDEPKIEQIEVKNEGNSAQPEEQEKIVTDKEKLAEQSGGNSTHPDEQEQMVTGEEKVAEISDTHMNGTETDESKKRKRKNAKKHRSTTERPSLRVMPKSEWKAYRNKYLELQRTTMSLLKKQIMLETQELKEHDSHVKAMDVSETKKSLQFQPGVIIKVKLSKPVKNSSEIKDQVKANAVVAYIDAPMESSEVFIRCHNSEEAQTIIKDDKLSQIGKSELLAGDEEKRYWEKIEQDRKTKFSNPQPVKKRGRDKLLAKAIKLEEMKNKHIYFDD